MKYESQPAQLTDRYITAQCSGRTEVEDDMETQNIVQCKVEHIDFLARYTASKCLLHCIRAMLVNCNVCNFKHDLILALPKNYQAAKNQLKLRKKYCFGALRTKLAIYYTTEEHAFDWSEASSQKMPGRSKQVRIHGRISHGPQRIIINAKTAQKTPN